MTFQVHKRESYDWTSTLQAKHRTAWIGRGYSSLSCHSMRVKNPFSASLYPPLGGGRCYKVSLEPSLVQAG